MRNIFWNEAEGRIRALWRILIFLVMYAFVASVIGGILTVGGVIIGTVTGALDVSAGTISVQSTPAVILLNSVGLLLATVLSLWLAGRFIDKRPFADFGMQLKQRDWWIDLAFGLGLGALLMALMFALELALGWITITGAFASPSGAPFAWAILGPAVIFLSVGIYEELLFRGYLLTNIAEGLARPFTRAGGIICATLITAALFGLGHAANPNASAISTFNIGLAGIFLALGYLLTGRMAIPIGLHITWNFFQGNVFGWPVSGGLFGPSFITVAQGGPELFTGGEFGPEAGLIGLGAMLLGSLLTWLYVRARYGVGDLYLPLAEPPARPAELAPTPAPAGD